jgi:autotransporter-associated beta strand protein
MRLRSSFWLSALALVLPAVAHGQAVFTYNTVTSSNAWTNSANWAGGPAFTYPGTTNGGVNTDGNVGDVATIGTFAFAAGNGLGINFNTVNGALAASVDGVLSLGAIDFTSATNNLTIGNSSPTVNGVLQLNGANVNEVANTLIAVRGTRDLTIANVNSGSGTQTMRLDLGIANGVFAVDTGRTLTISSIIAEAGGSNGFTAQGGGTVRLLGANTYTGTTTVAANTTLQVGNAGTTGTLGNGTGAVVVNGNLTFNRTDNITVANAISGNGTLNFGTAGTVTLTGTVAPGTSIGTLSAVGTMNLSGTYAAELGAGGTSDLLDLSAGANTLNLNDGSTVSLLNDGFTRPGALTTYTLADLQDTTAGLLQLNGVNLAPDTDITIYQEGVGQTNVNGSVNLTVTGLGLMAGDTLTLRRDAGGDLVVVFTPVPEPGTILAVCGLAVAGGAAWRRWRTGRTPAAV